MSRSVVITSFATWTTGGVSLNGPPQALGSGGLGAWKDSPSIAQIHPQTRRPHASATALVQLAHCVLSKRDPRMGLVIGTAAGSASADFDFLSGLQERGPAFGSPSIFVYTLPSSAPAEVSIALGLKGPQMTLSCGAASGLTALATAAAQVASGRLEGCLCGGTELGIPAASRAPETPGDWLALFLVEPFESNTRRTEIQSWSSGQGASGSPATLSEEPSLLTIARFLATGPDGASLSITATSREGGWTRVNLAKAPRETRR